MFLLCECVYCQTAGRPPHFNIFRLLKTYESEFYAFCARFDLDLRSENWPVSFLVRRVKV